MGPPERLGERHRLPQQPDDRSRKPQCENDTIQANHLPPKSKVPPGAQDLPSADHPARAACLQRQPGRKTSPSAREPFCMNPAQKPRRRTQSEAPAVTEPRETHSPLRARRRRARAFSSETAAFAVAPCPRAETRTPAPQAAAGTRARLRARPSRTPTPRPPPMPTARAAAERSASRRRRRGPHHPPSTVQDPHPRRPKRASGGCCCDLRAVLGSKTGQK